jgi:hypothetical protein
VSVPAHRPLDWNLSRVDTATFPLRTVSIWRRAWSLSVAVLETMQSAGAQIL